MTNAHDSRVDMIAAMDELCRDAAIGRWVREHPVASVLSAVPKLTIGHLNAAGAYRSAALAAASADGREPT
jgi:hypothetical protein